MPAPSVARRTVEVEDVPDLTPAWKAVWRHLTEDSAAAYVKAVLGGTRVMRKVHPWLSPMPFMPVDPRPLQTRKRIGDYETDAFLGMGGTGGVVRARHVETGRVVALKLSAKFDTLTYRWLGDDLPPQFLRLIDWGTIEVGSGEPIYWQAREYADESWRSFMARRRGAPVGISSALAVFATACQGVAGLHAQRVYQWSAHAGNVFRVGSAWKLGDLGRCFIATGPDDPRLVRSLGSDFPAVARSVFLGEFQVGPWIERDDAVGTIFFARNADREHRLRQDDCSMLGGLLCDLLGVNRWQVFYQALRSKPLCSGRYHLTGDRRRDERLSAILNSCWRGDAGGALLVASGGRGEQTTYDDPLELLADVRRAVRG